MDALTSELSRGAARIGRFALPASVDHAARRCLLDWLAATLGGSASPLAPKLLASVADSLGTGSAQVVGSGIACAPRTAALVNGTLAHAIEFDDIYSPGLYHPGAPVIAATIAVAQGRSIPVPPAIVAGYEVSNRIATTINPGHYRHFHTTGTVGTLGAAVAAGVALGLDETGIAAALGHAASMAAGLQQAFRGGGDTKPLHAGRAAEAGVFAAQAARAGLEGPANMLDGDAGLGAAMGAGACDWTACANGLGDEFTIERTTVKNHGCCGHSFAALDALIAMRDQLDADGIDRIEVGTYAAAVGVVGKALPASHRLSPSEARFSLAYCAAAALLDGRVRLDAFDDTRLRDPKLRALAARVTVTVDGEAEAAFPARRGATVTVKSNNAPDVTRRIGDRLGSPNAPLDDSALRDKLVELGEPAIGAERCRRLAEIVMRTGTRLDADTVLVASTTAAAGTTIAGSVNRA